MSHILGQDTLRRQISQSRRMENHISCGLLEFCSQFSKLLTEKKLLMDSGKAFERLLLLRRFAKREL